MSDIESAKRQIREAYDLLDQVNKIMVLAGNDFKIKADGVEISVRLNPEKIKEVEDRLVVVRAQLLGKINGLPTALA